MYKYFKNKKNDESKITKNVNITLIKWIKRMTSQLNYENFKTNKEI